MMPKHLNSKKSRVAMLLLNHNLVIAMIIDGKLCVTTELNQECTTKESDKAL